MLITGIKSKPVYEPLQADVGGRYHLLLGVGDGAAAVLRVAKELQSLAPASLGNSRVLLAPHAFAAATPPTGSPPPTGSVPTPHTAQPDPTPVSCVNDQPFKDIGLSNVQTFDCSSALLEEFRNALDQSLMGTRLYVAGPESFIGLAMKSALEYNLNKDEIRAEDIGSLARRVYCIHCRSTAEEVTTNIVECPGCKRWLLVRDHYSRRIAAYMGVMVDAEAPGERPEIKQVFL